MATYDNDLRLKEIATGDESGTWGTSTNLNLELIGEALGYGTQDCFATDADATTTVADGAADPARAMYFKVTSSATLTATRVLTIAPNTVSRVMFIENATTGSQSITISQGSGANVTIATGRTAVVYLDGAGSGAAVVDALALVDPGVTDTLAEVLVAGNATGGTDIAVGTGDDITFADSSKAIFGAGSDLQIYHDGSNSYIDDAGTGNLRLRGSQILLEKYTGETILQGVADGAVYIYHDNAAKLATTATGIDVTGTVTADGLTVDGSGSFVASANDSFLSIAHTGTEARLSATYTSTGSWTPIVLRTQNESRLNIATNGDISFYEDTGTTAKFFWDADAESLGIGTTSPTEALDVRSQAVVGNGTDGVKLTYSTGNSSGIIDTGFTSTALEFRTGNSFAALIDSSGNVGIGTASPGSSVNYKTLTINGTTGGIVEFHTGAALQSYILGNSSELRLQTNSSQVLTFNTNGTERMRIDSSGNLLVGGTSAFADDSTTINSSGLVYASRAGNKSGHFNRQASDGEIVNFSKDGTTVGSIGTSGGRLYIGSDDTSIFFDSGTSPSIRPHGPADPDGVIDIGESGYRFKDLYLSGNAYADNFIGTNDTDTFIAMTGSNLMRFFTANSEAARLDASGNLLVGTTSTSIPNQSSNTGIFLFGGGSINVARNGDECAIFNRLTSDGEIVRIQKDGTTVGSIGTETSNSDLYIGNGDTAIMFHDGVDAIFPHNASTNAGRDAAIDIGYSTYRFKDLYLSGGITLGTNSRIQDTGGLYIGGSTATIFEIGAGSEVARIDSSGNLLVGTPSSAGRFCVEHSSTSTPAGFFNNPNSGTSGVQALGTSLPSTANNTNCYHLKSTTQGVASYYLYGDGSSSFTSDERQKKNIVTTRDGYLDDLKNLRVVDYHWNNQEDTEDKNIGLIAQEVEQVFPHLILEHELEGAGVRKNLKGSDFTFILIKAIQEQQDLIESLTARIAALEGAN